MIQYYSRNRACRPGFTLLELLVVVAIIGILAAILMPAIGTVRSRASSAECAAQLRQVGTGWQMYLQDHGNILPTSHLGDPFSGQGPYYNRDPRRIQAHIGPYLEIEEASTWSTSEDKMSFTELLSWDAWQGARRGPGPSIIGNLPIKLTNSPDPVKPPWGKSISLIENPSDSPMYTEADAVLVPSAGWSQFLPEQPVHGGYRNTLFFDGHVEQVDVSVDLRNPS